jgi:hypothetical protein
LRKSCILLLVREQMKMSWETGCREGEAAFLYFVSRLMRLRGPAFWWAEPVPQRYSH